jgi:hypothetical protein
VRAAIKDNGVLEDTMDMEFIVNQLELDMKDPGKTV